MQRLLVMRGGALGDFVLGLPALRTLRDGYPHARLELIAPGAVLPLASSMVDVATPLERSEVAALFDDSERLPEEIISRYRALDLAVLWLEDAEGAVRHNFQRLGTRHVLWAPALPPPGRHAADHLLETLEPLRLASSPSPIVQPSASARGMAHSLWSDLGLNVALPVVALHPGSGGDWKRWPVERFAMVADRLIEAGVGVVVIQGPADAAVVGQLRSRVQGKRPLVASGLGAEELAAFLSLASCYLGNDSGVTHLAAAVGAPTVAIFGPTDPAAWGPRGSHVAILQARTGCIPCGRERGGLCQDRVCLSNVAVDQVLEMVWKVMDL